MCNTFKLDMKKLGSEYLSDKTDSERDTVALNIQRLDSLFTSNDKVPFIKDMLKTENERKFVSRAVMVISGVLFLLSLVLVGVSLMMSESIDEMGKC